MATLVYVDQENDGIRTPAPSKQRARLQSAPGGVYAEKCLKTPRPARNNPQSGRKALGALNKVCAALSSSTQESRKPVSIPVKAKAEKSADQYPEVEKFFPYNPLDFESFSVPEEVRLSHLCLAGLSSVSGPPALPEEEDDELEPCPPPSPVEMRRELEAFLQTVNELTVDLPPEIED